MDYEAVLTEAYAAATAAILAKFKKGDTEHPFNCGFAWVTIDGTSPLARYCRKQIRGIEVERANVASRLVIARESTKEVNAEAHRKARPYGDKGYPSGWQFWKPGEWPSKEEAGVTVYGQDMDFMYAGARAFADVLAKHGYNGTVGTRLD